MNNLSKWHKNILRKALETTKIIKINKYNTSMIKWICTEKLTGHTTPWSTINKNNSILLLIVLFVL